ncbi:inositol monophosphatase family protein [Oceanobacillus arenosus]|nr:inositol monophosphatase family protein [Oceanobacillus arenosus]
MVSSLMEIDMQVKQGFKEIISFIHQSLSTELTIETKSNRRDLVSNIDKEVEAMIRAKIKEHYPSHEIIGEETKQTEELQSLEHVWTIDPIDGTTNFLKQIDHFCVLISYYENNVGKLGYIYDVMNDDLYHAMENEGAFLNGVKIISPAPISLEDGLVSCDIGRWHTKSNFAKLVNQCFDIRNFGCGGIDSIHVFHGKFAAFVNSDSGPWDLAAQLIFAKELGLKMSKFDGSPVDYLVGGDYILANAGCYEDIVSIMKGYES